MAPIKQRNNNNNLSTTSTSKEIGSITINSETSNSNKNIEKSIEVEEYDLDTEITTTMSSFTPQEIEEFIKKETELINSEISFYEEQIKQNENLLEKIKYLQERVSFIANEKANLSYQYQYIYPNKNFDELYEIALKEKPELKDYINGLEEDLESIKKEFELDEVTINNLKDLKTYEDYQKFINDIENDIACFNSGIYKYKSYLKILDYKYLNYNENYQNYQIREYNITKDNLLEVTYGNGAQGFKFSYSSYCKKFGYVDEFSFVQAIEKYFPESSGLITISDELLTIEAMAQNGNDEYKKIYLYLYENEGKKSAEKFLNAVQDEINNYGGKLKAEEFLKNLDENPDKATEYINNYLAEISKGTNDGIFNWFGNIKNTIDVIFDNDDAYVYSMHEYETMYILQALREKNYGLADENVYEISQSIGNMVPSIIISSATGCPTLGAVSMGVPAGGGAAHQGLVEGYSRGQSITYGVLTGISEVCLERVLGGIVGIGDVNVTSFKTLLQSMAREAVEESTQSYLDSAFRTGIFKEDYDLALTTQDAFKSGVYGAISGGIINSAMAGINYGINKNNGNIDVKQDTINEEINSININQVTEEISQIANETVEKVQELANNTINEQKIETFNENNNISNFTNEKGLIDVKLLPLSEHEEVRIVQEKVLNNEPLTLNERLKLRDSAVTEINGIKLYSDHMYRATSYNALLDYINSNAIRDNGQGKGYSAVNWYLGGTAKKYGKVIIETPANPNSFQLSDDYGGFISGNPNVRQAHSSNETPVKFDEVSRILFLDDTGKKVLKVVEPSNSVDLAKEVELGHLLYEQDHLLKIKEKAGNQFGEERQQQLDEINKKIESITSEVESNFNISKLDILPFLKSTFKNVSDVAEEVIKEDSYFHQAKNLDGTDININEELNSLKENISEELNSLKENVSNIGKKVSSEIKTSMKEIVNNLTNPLEDISWLTSMINYRLENGKFACRLTKVEGQKLPVDNNTLTVDAINKAQGKLAYQLKEVFVSKYKSGEYDFLSPSLLSTLTNEDIKIIEKIKEVDFSNYFFNNIKFNFNERVNKFLEILIDRNVNLRDDHIGSDNQIFNNNGSRLSRIYLTPPNSKITIDFLSEYINKCINNGLSTYDMKGIENFDGNQGDRTILYSEIETLPKRIAILEEIAQEHPDWIADFGEPLHQWGTIYSSYYGVCHNSFYFPSTYNDYVDYASEMAFDFAVAHMMPSSNPIFKIVDNLKNITWKKGDLFSFGKINDEIKLGEIWKPVQDLVKNKNIIEFLQNNKEALIYSYKHYLEVISNAHNQRKLYTKSNLAISSLMEEYANNEITINESKEETLNESNNKNTSQEKNYFHNPGELIEDGINSTSKSESTLQRMNIFEFKEKVKNLSLEDIKYLFDNDLIIGVKNKVEVDDYVINVSELIELIKTQHLYEDFSKKVKSSIPIFNEKPTINYIIALEEMGKKLYSLGIFTKEENLKVYELRDIAYEIKIKSPEKIAEDINIIYQKLDNNIKTRFKTLFNKYVSNQKIENAFNHIKIFNSDDWLIYLGKLNNKEAQNFIGYFDGKNSNICYTGNIGTLGTACHELLHAISRGGIKLIDGSSTGLNEVLTEYINKTRFEDYLDSSGYDEGVLEWKQIVKIVDGLNIDFIEKSYLTNDIFALKKVIDNFVGDQNFFFDKLLPAFNKVISSDYNIKQEGIKELQKIELELLNKRQNKSKKWWKKLLDGK